jgi:hypothetical protein
MVHPSRKHHKPKQICAKQQTCKIHVAKIDKGEINKFTIIIGDFNISLSTIRTRYKITKNSELTSTANLQD